MGSSNPMIGSTGPMMGSSDPMMEGPSSPLIGGVHHAPDAEDIDDEPFNEPSDTA